MKVRDIEGVVALQAACFPPPFPADQHWTPAHLARHLEVFPEGQFVAFEEGRVVGSASALILGDDAWNAHLSWEDATGGHNFAHHEPTGTTLYGADISVHPEARRRGVARALYAARFELVRSKGLRRFGTVCRLPGFSGSHFPSPIAYGQAVSENRAEDPTLTPLLRLGCRLVAIVEGYMHDPESGDAGGVLEWLP